MEVRYYLRNKLTKKLSQPFTVLDCALMFKKEDDEVFEVYTTKENECINTNSMST